MRPLDPRLLRHAGAARVHVAACIGLGGLKAGLILIQAGVLATLVSRAFLGGADVRGLAPMIGLLAGVILARAALSWAADVVAQAGATRVTTQLRDSLAAALLRLDPGRLDEERSGRLTILATTGIEALETYVRRYLPALFLAVLVPAAVLGRVLAADWISGLIIAVTLPLIPLFMALVGMATAARMRRQWGALEVLAHHFVDVLGGLPTLRIFGRARAQRTTLKQMAEEHRSATMAGLRVAFLSALVLELLATLSVALVAVSIGLRLIDGGLALRTGLLVLILAPEAYWPLREVGAQHHASSAGLAAADEIVTVLDAAPPRPAASAPAPDPARVRIDLQGVAVRRAERAAETFAQVSLSLAPGTVTGLIGPSGAGKSTVIALLLGFLRPDAGRVLVDGRDLDEFDPDAWRRSIAWVPQHPHLFAGTVADNIRLGNESLDHDGLVAAAAAAGLDIDPDTPVGEAGSGLSTGQRRRVALARALARPAGLLLLDEPTEGLDADTERQVLDGLATAIGGRTVLLVTHRPAPLALCDTVVTLEPAQVVA